MEPSPINWCFLTKFGKTMILKYIELQNVESSRENTSLVEIRKETLRSLREFLKNRWCIHKKIQLFIKHGYQSNLWKNRTHFSNIFLGSWAFFLLLRLCCKLFKGNSLPSYLLQTIFWYLNWPIMEILIFEPSPIFVHTPLDRVFLKMKLKTETIVYRRIMSANEKIDKENFQIN